MTLWREEAAPKREAAEKSISIFVLVSSCCCTGTDSSCPLEGLQLCRDRGSRSNNKGPLPGSPVVGTSPEQGTRACVYPAQDHAWAGPMLGHPGANCPGNQGLLPLYGEFLQEKARQPVLYFLAPDPIYIFRCSWGLLIITSWSVLLLLINLIVSLIKQKQLQPPRSHHQTFSFKPELMILCHWTMHFLLHNRWQ